MFKQLKNWLKTTFCRHVSWRWRANDADFGQHKTCVKCGKVVARR